MGNDQDSNAAVATVKRFYTVEFTLPAMMPTFDIFTFKFIYMRRI